MIKNFKVGTTSYTKKQVTSTWSQWEKSTLVEQNGNFPCRENGIATSYKKNPTRKDIIELFN